MVKRTGLIGKTGLDGVAYGLMTFASGFTTEIGCAVARLIDNRDVIDGDTGRVELADPWVPGRNGGPLDATIIVTIGNKSRVKELPHPEQLFAYEAETVGRAIADRLPQARHPAMTPADGIGSNATLDCWRAEVGYVTFAEDPKLNCVLFPVVPRGLPQIPKAAI